MPQMRHRARFQNHAQQRADVAGELLLSAIADDTGDEAWRNRARCAETDPESFFPEKGGSTREAKLVCRGCEVRAECLAYALERDERFGVWGGLSERERRRFKREAA